MHHELYRIGAVAMLISVAGCVHGPAGHAHRHEPGHGASTGLTVLGSGEAKGAPDVARSSIGIEVRAETAEQATTQANERMAAVIAAVKSAGVAAEDIRTP